MPSPQRRRNRILSRLRNREGSDKNANRLGREPRKGAKTDEPCHHELAKAVPLPNIRNSRQPHAGK